MLLDIYTPEAPDLIGYAPFHTSDYSVADLYQLLPLRLLYYMYLRLIRHH